MPQRTKSAENPAKPVTKPDSTGVMVPGKNGGMIWRGPSPNHVPGPGRPSSALRETMRMHLDNEVLADMLEKYRNGEVDVMDVANFLAKYGLGEKNEITLVSEEVRTRIQATVNLAHAKAPHIIEELDMIWSAD